MNDASSSSHVPTWRLIHYPAIITLAVTLLRVAGELLHGSKTFFNSEPGGAWAIVGIVWLVPIFGVYFALRLAREGDCPAGFGRAFGLAVLGASILAAGFFLFQNLIQTFSGVYLMWSCAAVGAALQILAWRRLFKVLAAYAYAARVPVAVVMLIATWADWPSHYNARAPGFSPIEGYFLWGFIPQLVWWVSFTIVVGTLAGVTAITIRQRANSIPAKSA
jgi:hypothetical protein